MWVNIPNSEVEVRCVKNPNRKDKPFRYEAKTNDEISVIGMEKNSPIETSAQSQFHKYIKSILRNTVYPNELDAKLISLKNQVESAIELDKTVSEEAKLEQQSQRERDEKYDLLYTNFNFFLKEYDMTPLELIVATSHCLGVGKPREIVRAFFGYFQTYCGEKGTNVIAIGSPASGKSFTLETALSMIPQESIIKGAKTVAYFFRKYNHQDLTGKIFFIGDLGGSEDDQETIKFRDKLKQLTTDGYAERGVVDKDSMEEEDQWVEGYPSLSYTTAREEMVNEQEKTRSVILTPTPLDTAKLLVFKWLMENRGSYSEKIEKVFSIRDSIQGLVYRFRKDDFDWFNPYMFCIEEHLKDHDDFPRKIDEFNAILKLVTILNSPTKLFHQLYYDDEYEEMTTEVFISSKRDNINALNIFDSANLLPDETRFANGLISEYEVVDVDSYLGSFEEDDLWEEKVTTALDSIDHESGEWILGKNTRDYCFTLKTLARDHRDKRWYRKSRNYIQERIQRLMDENIIVNVGKEKGTRHNVYCLNEGMTSSVDSPLPNFDKKSNLEKANTLFQRVYPSKFDEYIEFVVSDVDVDTTDLFEQVRPIIEDLPYLESVFDDL